MSITRTERRARIKRRVRGKISRGRRQSFLRLSVFRSNKEIYGQIIDDREGKTIVGASSLGMKSDNVTKTEKAKLAGIELAKRAIEKGIETVVFDRNGYLYHGRIKAFADGAREGGLKF